MKMSNQIALLTCLVALLSLVGHYWLLCYWGQHLELARAEIAAGIANAEGRVLNEVISQEFRLEIKDLSPEERLEYVALLACQGEEGEEIRGVEAVAMVEEVAPNE